MEQQKNGSRYNSVQESNAYVQQTDFDLAATKLKTCLMITAVAMTFSLLVLSLVAVIVLGGYFGWENSNLQTKLQQQGVTDNRRANNSMDHIVQLELKIMQLERALDQTKQHSQKYFDKLEETQQALNDSLEHSVESLEHQLNQTKQQSKGQFDKLEETQQALNDSLEYSVDSLKQQLNQTKQQSQEQFEKLKNSQQELNISVDSLNIAQDNTMTHLSSLQSSVNTLTTQVNSSESLYQNCIQETSNCTITGGSGTNYWRWCFTPALPVNRTGYYTTDIRCEFERNPGYLETTPMHRTGGSSVQCECLLTIPSSSTHTLIPSSLSVQCFMIITRCPV